MQASIDTYDARVTDSQSRNSSGCKRSNVQASCQNLYFICQKVNHLIPDDKLMRYVKEFLSKPVKVEYFVNKPSEIEV